MSISKNIKSGFLKRKRIEAQKRTILLKRPELFSKVLLVVNTPDNALNQAARTNFPAAEINTLFIRKEKENQSLANTYSVHATDFNLTGNLKSDKLSSLIQTEFDLLIDLSKDSELLTYLVRHLKSTLIVGQMNHPNEMLYDLFFEKSGSDQAFLNVIVTQLNQLIKK